MTDFSSYSTSHLARWWNEREGALSWLTALERELRSRGVETRKADGTRLTIEKDAIDAGLGGSSNATA